MGAALLAMALAGWLSLATWSIHDPSLNHATRGATGNLLAYWGAVTADLSIQSLGLGAIVLFLPLAAWGHHIAFGQIPLRAKLRLAAWPVGVLLVAGGLSALPEPESWPLPNGLGGIMGDLTLGAAGMVLAPLPGLLMRGVAAILFACTILRQSKSAYAMRGAQYSERANERLRLTRRLKRALMYCRSCGNSKS